MKIAFFVSGFPWFSETFILNQITGLIDRGHDVEVYAEEIYLDAAIRSDLRKYRLPERTRYRRSVRHTKRWRRACGRIALFFRTAFRHPMVAFRSLNAFAFGRRALSLDVLDMAVCFVNRPSYDIVHAHFGYNGNDAAILMSLGLLKGKLVTTFHGYDIRAGVAHSGNIYNQLRQHCDAVHSISSYNQEKLEAFGFDRGRIFYHPIGVDLRRFRPKNSNGRTDHQDDVTVLITVARLAAEKGLEVGLRALGQVRRQRPDLEFIYNLVGSGPLESLLRSLSQELGLGGRIRFMGRMEPLEVAAALADADIFLLPSLAEALPMSILEAMACALPVIATDVGGVSELVRDGKTGRLVRPADAESLAKVIIELLDRQTERTLLGRAGQPVVERNYSIDVLNDRLVEHYQDLLGRKHHDNYTTKT